MRNTLQEQYNSLKEGKGNKQQFFKSARHLFPDLITPVNTFEDTVRILKNRGIITESIGGIVTKSKTPDWHAIFKENITEAAKEAKAEEKETTKEVTDMATRGYDYKDEKNYDNVFGQEFLQGYYTEMKDPKNEGKHVEELRQIVAKNLAKDINHYVKDGQFGTKGVGYTVDAPGLGETKPAKGKHKSSGYGDLKESKEKKELSLKQIDKKDKKGLSLYKNTENPDDLYYYDGKVLYSVVDRDKKGPSVRMSLFNITGLEDNMNESLKESVLRSQIHLLAKEILSEEGNNPTEEEKKLNALKEKALKQAGAAISSVGTNTHKVTFEHDGKTVAIAFRDSEKKAEETAEKLKKTGLLKNVKVTLNK